MDTILARVIGAEVELPQISKSTNTKKEGDRRGKDKIATKEKRRRKGH